MPWTLAAAKSSFNAALFPDTFLHKTSQLFCSWAFLSWRVPAGLSSVLMSTTCFVFSFPDSNKGTAECKSLLWGFPCQSLLTMRQRCIYLYALINLLTEMSSYAKPRRSNMNSEQHTTETASWIESCIQGLISRESFIKETPFKIQLLLKYMWRKGQRKGNSASTSKTSFLYWMDMLLFPCTFALKVRSFQLYPGRRHRGTTSSLDLLLVLPLLMLLQRCLTSFATSIASSEKVLAQTLLFRKSGLKSSQQGFCGFQSCLNNLILPNCVSHHPSNPLLF